MDSAAPDTFNRIRSIPFVSTCFYFDELDSTNTYAKTVASLSGNKLTVIVAGRQTAGRGQRSNSFFSHVNGGLFATFICPVPDIAQHFVYNRALSLAIVTSLQNRFPKAPLYIKWPNDIYWSTKKICGILLESLPVYKNHIALGFGINVNIPIALFPCELLAIATSVLQETNSEIDIMELLYDILILFDNYAKQPVQTVHALYKKKLYRLGASIEINDAKGLFTGVLEDGKLCLETKTGITYHVSGTMRFVKE